MMVGTNKLIVLRQVFFVKEHYMFLSRVFSLLFDDFNYFVGMSASIGPIENTIHEKVIHFVLILFVAKLCFSTICIKNY